MLTPAQLTTLKSHILANSSAFADGPFTGQTVAQVAALPGSESRIQIARWYNLTATGPFVVWRTSVTWDEIMLNGMDWARVDNLSVGKARIWDWMFQNQSRTFNPSKSNIRTGIDATWVGTAPDLAVRAAVYVHCKRAATNGEKVFATGTGSDAAPATMAFEGQVSSQEVDSALNLE